MEMFYIDDILFDSKIDLFASQAQLTQRKDVCERMQQFYDKLDSQFKNYMKLIPDNIKIEAEKACCSTNSNSLPTSSRLKEDADESTDDVVPESSQVNLPFHLFSSKSTESGIESVSNRDSNIASALDLLDSS